MDQPICDTPVAVETHVHPSDEPLSVENQEIVQQMNEKISDQSSPYGWITAEIWKATSGTVSLRVSSVTVSNYPPVK